MAGWGVGGGGDVGGGAAGLGGCKLQLLQSLIFSSLRPLAFYETEL